jgi:threonine synthase
MDIQISSNFERLLFEAHDRDAAAVRGLMEGLKQSGGFTISEKPLAAIRSEFSAGRSSVEETAQTIQSVLETDGYLLDPHSAIAVKVARENVSEAAPMVVLATAHPAKFPDAVKAASGVTPALPAWLSDLMERKESFTVLHNDLKIVEEYVRRHSRA